MMDCPLCGGSTFVKLPLGAPGDGREVEDEDNCWCECHHYEHATDATPLAECAICTIPDHDDREAAGIAQIASVR